MDVANITAVLLYVAPGFLAVQLRYFLVPARKGSDFELLAWSVVISVASYEAACFAVFLRHGAGWRDATGLGNWPFVLFQWGFAFALGYLLAFVSTRDLTRRLLLRVGIDYSQFPSVWNETWQRPQGAPWVRVRMTDGSVCCGAVAQYTRDPAETDREMYLYPIFSLDEQDEPKERLPGVGVFIRAAQIVSVELLDVAE